MDETKARLIVAVSGSGRTLENFIAREGPAISYTVAGVIASKPDCRGCEIARKKKLPLFIGHFTKSQMSETFQKVYTWIDEVKGDWIALGGFLRSFPIRDDWNRRITNIHPALLPNYGGQGMYGDRVHEAVIDAGDAHSGATVHYINDRYDEGDIIAQALVEVPEDRRVDTLAKRVFAAECELYPPVIDRLIRGSLPLADGAIERFHHES